MLVLLLLGLKVLSTFSMELYSSEHFEDYFEEFIVGYNRSYTAKEKKIRFEIFKNNLIEINMKNVQLGENVMGITKFCDYSKNEIQGLLGFKPDTGVFSACEDLSVENINPIKSPDSFDWRDKHVVSRVKNQEHCGSCYAFSTTGNIESQYAIKHHEIKVVSEQQILDCSGQYKCLGGFVQTSLKLIQEGGSDSEADYPYEAANGTCRFDSSRIAIQVTGCNEFTITDEDQFQDLVYKYGPISLYIFAANLPTYKGGIVTKKLCRDNGLIDHAVLLVGYGTENGQKYWIIKNSWGPNWGEEGYFRLARGENACNLVNEYPVPVAVVA